MPVVPPGVYQPLDAYTKDEIGQYIGGVLRREPGLSNLELKQRIGTRFDVDQSDTLVLQRIINQEKVANEIGNQSNTNPGQPPAMGDIPTIPYDPEDSGRVITNIVVEIIDNNTGERTTSNEQWISDQPVSADEIRDQIEADLTAYIQTMGTQPTTAADSEDVTVNVIIMGVFIGG